MLSVQLGAAVSIGLFDDIGVAGTAWLRLTLSAIVLILLVRPRYWQWSMRQLRAPVLLGVVSAGMTLCFLAAIDRLPLGTVVAIEFLGPLTVAALSSRTRRALAWPALALIGVVLLMEPWQADVDLIGIALAAVAAVGWALYIVITQHVGDRFDGFFGLSVSIPVAALITAVVGVPQAWGNLTLEVLLVGLGAAALLPLIPWSLEFLALRRLTKAAFGTLMALEPAFAAIIGFLVLSQGPQAMDLIGVALVIVAGVAAARTGDRDQQRPDLESPIT
ncbi:MAG TPA: EamA family transporter [Actinobacteria bacterium]|nr:EamA family transporter [Actinomycetota bacterium]